MNRIAESELILNKDGSVYHLHLLPDEVAETIITVGDPERVRQVTRHFDKMEVVKKNREFISHTGKLGKKRITVVSTGIGTDNIDIVLSELDALVNVDFDKREVKENLTSLNIIRIGTSGALQEDIDLDSFVITEKALGMDNLMHFYKHKNSLDDKKILSSFKSKLLSTNSHLKPYIVSGSHKLIEQIGKGMTKGITVTCSGFYGPQGRWVRGEPSLPKWIDKLSAFKYLSHRITNMEMETSGIYGMANILGHEAVSVSAIVANRIQKKFSAKSHELVEDLIEKVLERIG